MSKRAEFQAKLAERIASATAKTRKGVEGEVAEGAPQVDDCRAAIAFAAAALGDLEAAGDQWDKKKRQMRIALHRMDIAVRRAGGKTRAAPAAADAVAATVKR